MTADEIKIPLKIYIDFDDVLCETAKYFTKIANDNLT